MNVKQYKIVSYGRKYCWICRVAAEPEGGGQGPFVLMVTKKKMV